MSLKRTEQTRAEGEGYYHTSYGSDASDVLNYVSGDMVGVQEDKPYDAYGKIFKITVIVEEV
jgi:hypothetical protein